MLPEGEWRQRPSARGESILSLSDPYVFQTDPLAARAQDLHDNFVHADPFPSIVIDDFLPEDQADFILSEFPDPDSDAWLDWRKRDLVHQPKKQGIGHARNLEKVSPHVQHMLMAFNSYPFLNFLEVLTGIEKLLPDPHFHGGGLHQILSGGKLMVHADFNKLRELDLYRRLNVLLYLNKDWQDEYGGHLELWDASMSNCVQRIAPIFNRLVVFRTNKTSFHGHPDPLATPEGVTRKSLALYYYTAKPSESDAYDGNTDWQE